MEDFCPKNYWALTDAIPFLLHTQVMLCQGTGGGRGQWQEGPVGWQLGTKVTPSTEIFE